MKPLASTTRSPRRTAAIGVLAATLTVGATGAAYALAQNGRTPAPTTVVAGGAAGTADVPADAAAAEQPDAAEDDETPGPDEYTQERSDAFWGAGYTMADADALSELWQLPILEAKGRAGRLLLDGRTVPVAPGTSPEVVDPAEAELERQLVAFWDAGYDVDDASILADLWSVDVLEAKTTGGQMLLDGQALPIAPSGTPVS